MNQSKSTTINKGCSLKSGNLITNPRRNQHNEVQCVVPDWEVPGSVCVFSTTRLGGVSEAPYDALNLGLHVDDKLAPVMENRALLRSAVQAPSEPVWLDQVHGHDVIFVDSYHNRDEIHSADGSMTREPGQVLGVLTADCLPVVIANEQGTAVAVVHAGWRGLADGVLQSGLAHFPETDNLHAWLGPAIGPDKFEVGKEVVDVFLERDKKFATGFKPAGGTKFMANLYTLARTALNIHRPVHITGGDFCTYKDKELFHSYRRDGKQSGRMATIAWLK